MLGWLIFLSLLIIPPVLIARLPTPWLALAIPIGLLGFYVLTHYIIASFSENDSGPGGFGVMVFFSLMVWINFIALPVRLMRSL